jgi:hypothetical protein
MPIRIRSTLLRKMGCKLQLGVYWYNVPINQNRKRTMLLVMAGPNTEGLGTEGLYNTFVETVP